MGLKLHALITAGVLVAGTVGAFQAETVAASAATAIKAECPKGLLRAAEVAKVSVTDCDLVGELVSVGPVSLPIQPPGRGVAVSFVEVDPTKSAAVYIETTPAGFLSMPEAQAATPQSSDAFVAALAGGPCEQDGNAFLAFRENGTHSWAINTSTFPSNLTVSTTVTSIRGGVQNIVNQNTDCAVFGTDEVDASAQYAGTTSYQANIDPSNNCFVNNNGSSTVSFGTQTSTRLATSCMWTSGGDLYEADTMINKASFTWTNTGGGSGCSNAYDVENIMTHEFGHVFALDHVSEATYPDLTMSSKLNPCAIGARTLGRGDVLGLRAKY